MPESFAILAGAVLRRVRQHQGLSLRQVTVRSNGRFKPSSIASYERGERQISLERLFALAEVYGVAPEQVVAAIADRLERAGETTPSRPGRDDPRILDSPFGESPASRDDPRERVQTPRM